MRLSRKTALVAGVMLATGLLLTYIKAAPAYLPQYAMPDWHTLELQDADLIFRRGIGWQSEAVLASSSASPRFSHVGLLIHKNSSWYVIHATPAEDRQPGGVILEPLQRFASPQLASRIGIYRYPKLNPQEKEKIIKTALTELGKPFDPNFSMHTNNEIYCSELVVKSFHSAGLHIDNPQDYVSISLLPEPALPPDSLRQGRGIKEILDSYIYNGFKNNAQF